MTRRDGVVEPEHLCRMAIAIVHAVGSAHMNGVIHRDLKPANVLIDDRGHPHVADFGIAYITDDSVSNSRALTLTPLFSAPETIEGNISTTLSDIYSLGATFYAALNGSPAFSGPSGESILKVLERITKADLEPLSDSVPQSLANVIYKAMRREPQLRYQSTAEFVADLEAELAAFSEAQQAQLWQAEAPAVSTSTTTNDLTPYESDAGTDQASSTRALTSEEVAQAKRYYAGRNAEANKAASPSPVVGDISAETIAVPPLGAQGLAPIAPVSGTERSNGTALTNGPVHTGGTASKGAAGAPAPGELSGARRQADAVSPSPLAFHSASSPGMYPGSPAHISSQTAAPHSSDQARGSSPLGPSRLKIPVIALGALVGLLALVFLLLRGGSETGFSAENAVNAGDLGNGVVQIEAYACGEVRRFPALILGENRIFAPEQAARYTYWGLNHIPGAMAFNAQVNGALNIASIENQVLNTKVGVAGPLETGDLVTAYNTGLTEEIGTVRVSEPAGEVSVLGFRGFLSRPVTSAGEPVGMSVRRDGVPSVVNPLLLNFSDRIETNSCLRLPSADITPQNFAEARTWSAHELLRAQSMYELWVNQDIDALFELRPDLRRADHSELEVFGGEEPGAVYMIPVARFDRETQWEWRAGVVIHNGRRSEATTSLYCSVFSYDRVADEFDLVEIERAVFGRDASDEARSGAIDPSALYGEIINACN